MSENRVIGQNNSLPWHISEDLRRFSQLTSGHAVLMGRKTYDSLPEKYKPLPNRKNIVASRDKKLKLREDVLIINDVLSFIGEAKEGKINLPSNQLWIIGGQEIFSLTQSFVEEIHLTIVNGQYEGDAFMPEFESDYRLLSEKGFEDHSYLVYSKIIIA